MNITEQKIQAYNIVKELTSSSVEGLKVSLTFDELGQPKITLGYTGENGEENAKRITSAFKTLKDVGATITPVATVKPAPEPVKYVRKGFGITAGLDKEITYLSKYPADKSLPSSMVTKTAIFERLLNNYIEELGDNPIGNIRKIRNVKNRSSAMLTIPKSVNDQLKKWAKEANVSVSNVFMEIILRALKQPSTLENEKKLQYQKRFRNISMSLPMTLELSELLKKASRELIGSSRVSIAEYIARAVSELASDGDLSSSKRGTKIIFNRDIPRWSIRVSKQTHKDIDHMAHKYRMPYSNVVLEAVLAKLQRENKLTGDIDIKRVSTNTNR